MTGMSSGMRASMPAQARTIDALRIIGNNSHMVRAHSASFDGEIGAILISDRVAKLPTADQYRAIPKLLERRLAAPPLDDGGIRLAKKRRNAVRLRHQVRPQPRDAKRDTCTNKTGAYHRDIEVASVGLRHCLSFSVRPISNRSRPSFRSR
jgi:hypothetical protein